MKKINLKKPGNVALHHWFGLNDKIWSILLHGSGSRYNLPLCVVISNTRIPMHYGPKIQNDVVLMFICVKQYGDRLCEK